MSNSTIYDVAGAAGVSLATVSRVLNNPSRVSEATRERVLKVIKELGYRPNMIARGLASKKTTTVGVIISDVTRASTAQILGGISDIAQNYHYSIKVFTIYEDSDVADVVAGIVAEQVDGILYLNDELTDIDVERIRKVFDDNNIPYVFANVPSSDPTVPSISIDYAKAGYEITKEMINKNCKDLYMISTVRRYAANDKKEEGYTKAMQEANLTPMILRTSSDVLVNQQHFATYFEDKKVDGIIAVRDSIAVSFMNVAIDNGKKVPDELQVAGFQNTKYALLARPQLTSIDIPVYDIGAVAMRLLTKLMQKQEVENTKIILPHHIMQRKTTK